MKNYQKVFFCLCLSLMLQQIIIAKTIIDLKEKQEKTGLTPDIANYILKV
jgi:hypothetical protein